MFSIVRRAVALALFAGVAVTALPAAPAGASLHTITIDGHGYGHGRGMGQWGARGMADGGAKWKVILAHYYPGTTLKRRPSGERIRVLVDSGSTVVVSSVKRYRMQWGDGTPIGSNDSRRRFVRVRFERGRYVLEKSAHPWGPWKRVTRSARPVVFVRGREPLEVVSARGSSREYRGTIEVRRDGGRLDAINHLPLEEYLMGVVPREMPSTWPAEALRAQAVAARSYAAAIMENHHGLYDICATTACQVYGGRAARAMPADRAVMLERPRANAAVFSTQGIVMTWRGKPILAEYSSSTGGVTAAGKQPYLRSVDDPGDRVSPTHGWTVQVNASAIERNWRVGRLRSIEVRARDGRRVRLVRISGTRGTADVAGGTFASRLGLRSRWFDVRRPKPPYRFVTNERAGSHGAAVAELQRRLKTDRFYARRITAYFDNATLDALRRYQRSRKIRPTGNLGPKTRARLNAEASQA